jgi:hypothetical protein
MDYRKWKGAGLDEQNYMAALRTQISLENTTYKHIVYKFF